MSVRQYGRKVSLVIGQDAGDALDLSNLRIKFDVRRGDIQTPNSADIRIYNLKPETANRIEKEFTRVVLQAGYEGNYGIIFDGQVFQVRRGRESPTDTYLDITALDGDSAYNFAVVNVSIAAGASAADQASAATNSMEQYGVSNGYSPNGMGDRKQSRGVVMYGMARDYLRNVARTTDCTWSIQDGKVNFVPLSAYMPGEIPVITSATGMVGLPEQTQNGIKVKMLLNPSIKIGTLIQIDNASIQSMKLSIGLKQAPDNQMNLLAGKTDNDGFYYVMIAEHHGDTRGNDFYTDVICLARDATMPNGLQTRTAVGDPMGIKPYG